MSALIRTSSPGQQNLPYPDGNAKILEMMTGPPDRLATLLKFMLLFLPQSDLIKKEKPAWG
jgi:hypothetical protein